MARPFMGERVPQHVQNIVLRNFAELIQAKLLLAATEYAMEKSHLILDALLSSNERSDGIVMYSLFQLPSNKERRLSIYQTLLARNKSLYFAVENMSILMATDIDIVEQCWQIKRTTALLPSKFGEEYHEAN
jgi:sporadic carbohydrate cluster protein (TIGR04323 family)